MPVCFYGFMQTVNQVVWHRQGDYLAVVTDGASAATTVVIHRLSKRQSQVHCHHRYIVITGTLLSFVLFTVHAVQ